MMAAILNSAGVDSEEAVALRFLPYQMEAIYDDARKQLAKKAVRVGYTFAKAFKAVRSSLLKRKEDTLFVTKDQVTAFEFISNCRDHIEHFAEKRSVISDTAEDVMVPVFDEEGKDSGITEKITVSKITFDNRSRILAFSSNPNAIRAYGGNVMWDEAAFHPKGKAMWAAIQGRARWGYNIDVWSSLSMDDTMFDVLATQAKKPDSDWSFKHVDIYEAVEAGLVELINQQRGLSMTREEFLADCKSDCVVPGIFALEYEIKKENSLSPIVEWEKLNAAQRPIEIERSHLSHQNIVDLFGRAEHASTDALRGVRRREVERWMDANFAKLFKKGSGRRFRFGFDVAASRKGDLASMWIDEKVGDHLRHRALLTFRSEDWDVMQWCAEFFFVKTPGEMLGCGDETGLGKQICWNLAMKFYSQFEGVNFGAKKNDIGTSLMTNLAAGLSEFSDEHPDVTQDIYCLRKGIKKDQVYFFETKNELLPESHADIGWSKALAAYADRGSKHDIWVLDQKPSKSL